MDDVRLTVEYVAKYLKISPQHLRELIKRKLVPFGIALEINQGKFTYYIFTERFKAWLKGIDMIKEIAWKKVEVKNEKQDLLA